MSTLSELIDRVEIELSDASNDTFSTSDLTAAIRHALRVWCTVSPFYTSHTITLATDGREIDLSSITNLGWVMDVWFPYVPEDPDYPIGKPAWSKPDPFRLRLETLDTPRAGQKMRLLATTDHTISGLDSATETTLDGIGELAIVLGASAHAAQQHAFRLNEAVLADYRIPQRLREWGRDRMEQMLELMRSARVAALSNQEARCTWSNGTARFERVSS